MIVKTKNNRQVLLRRLGIDDIDILVSYLQLLSPETKKRFGPHPFDKQSVIDIYTKPKSHLGYIAQDIETLEIIAYSILRKGYLDHDGLRLQSYGLTLNNETDCTFAPSVTDIWQSQGIGNHLFRFILADLKIAGIKRIILWGGVQTENEKAVNYYKKHGFKTIGRFEYNGWNFDMVLDLKDEI
jgi:diamine N-acetyltransferase